MNYINPVEYSNLLKSFTQQATKQTLKESVEEGMHLDKVTAPTNVAVESKRDYKNLSVDERKQLKELIESVKTIKQEIKKLMEKATMGEGGDTTGLVMPEGDDDLGYATHDGSFDGDDSEEDATDAFLTKIEKEKSEEDTVAASIV